jgi:hypothetical protein
VIRKVGEVMDERGEGRMGIRGRAIMIQEREREDGWTGADRWTLWSQGGRSRQDRTG